QAGPLRMAGRNDVRRGHAALRRSDRPPARPARVHLWQAPRGPGGLRPQTRRALRRNADMRSAAVLILATGLALAGGVRRAGAGQFGVSLEGGYFAMTGAQKSAEAIFGGSSGGFTGGGSLRYVVGRSFFVGAGARYFEKKGERAFVADATSPAFPLGHPLTFRTVPVYGMVGWRFRPD